MKLILSEESPLSTTMADSDGRILYKALTSSTMGSTTTHISRVHHTSTHPLNEKRDAEFDEFSQIAEIEYHTIRQSKMRQGGKEMDMKEFINHSNGGYIFTGPDRASYKWMYPILETNDETKTQVAGYTVARRNTHEQGILDVLPEVEKMMDLIVVTFLYVEKMEKRTLGIDMTSFMKNGVGTGMINGVPAYRIPT